MIESISSGESVTVGFARTLASIAQAGDCITLRGDLGAGKTAFARAFIQSLLAQEEDVTSPTFTLVQTYDTASGIVLYHADLYRLEDISETPPLGLEEAWEQGIVLIEWPEVMAPRLPADRLDIEITYGTEKNERLFCFRPHGAWKERLKMVNMPGLPS